jgi:hypothetical protein
VEAEVSRIIIAGGTGFFGRAAAELLTALGQRTLIASRRPGADVRLDVEDRGSLAAALRPGDLVLDTAGPFQDRTTTLVEAAITIGCDVIDIADNVEHALRVRALRSAIDSAGIRVLSAASSVSAVSAALLTWLGIERPARLTGLLAPAARHSASAGTGQSLLRSIGQPIRVLRDGALTSLPGWSEPRRIELPEGAGSFNGRLFESADAVWLPERWPTLRNVEMLVDTRIPGLNGLFALAARRPWLRGLIERQQAAGRMAARLLGATTGCLGIEVASLDGHIARAVLLPRHHGHRVAVAPMVLAAAAITEGRFPGRGLVRPDQQVEAGELLDYLRGMDVALATIPAR